MDWNYFKIRRRTTLESFLNGVTSEREALELFEKKRLSNPPIDEIRRLFAPKQVEPEINHIAQPSDTVPPVTNANQSPSPTKKVKAANGSVGN